MRLYFDREPKDGGQGISKSMDDSKSKYSIDTQTAYAITVANYKDQFGKGDMVLIREKELKVYEHDQSECGGHVWHPVAHTVPYTNKQMVTKYDSGIIVTPRPQEAVSDIFNRKGFEFHKTVITGERAKCTLAKIGGVPLFDHLQNEVRRDAEADGDAGAATLNCSVYIYRWVLVVKQTRHLGEVLVPNGSASGGRGTLWTYVWNECDKVGELVAVPFMNR